MSCVDGGKMLNASTLEKKTRNRRMLFNSLEISSHE